MKEENYDRNAVVKFMSYTMQAHEQGMNCMLSMLYDGLNSEAGIKYFKTNEKLLRDVIAKGIQLLKQVGGSSDYEKKNIRRAIVSFLLTIQKTMDSVSIPSFPMYLEDFDDEKEFKEEIYV
jgi:dihydroxyacetone kinase